MMINYEMRFEKTYIELEALIEELKDECKTMDLRQRLELHNEDPDIDLVNALIIKEVAYEGLIRQLEKHCPFLLLN